MLNQLSLPGAPLSSSIVEKTEVRNLNGRLAVEDSHARRDIGTLPEMFMVVSKVNKDTKSRLDIFRDFTNSSGFDGL